MRGKSHYHHHRFRVASVNLKTDCGQTGPLPILPEMVPVTGQRNEPRGYAQWTRAANSKKQIRTNRVRYPGLEGSLVGKDSNFQSWQEELVDQSLYRQTPRRKGA